jgi:hypothetical protein
VNRLTVYVPPAYTRKDVSGQLDPQSDLRLREADEKTMVLADPAISQDCCRIFPAAYEFFGNANF